MLLNEAQHRALSIRIGSIANHLRELRDLGVETMLLDALQAAVVEVAADLHLSIDPVPQPLPSRTMLFISILLEEIEPKRLAAYGELDPTAERYLGPAIEQMSEFASDLLRDFSEREHVERTGYLEQ